MSGVYIIEISSREENEKNIIKIGSTSNVIEKRIEDVFIKNYDKNKYSYYIIETIPCNRSIAINLENYLINCFINILGDKRIGNTREFLQLIKV